MEQRSAEWYAERQKRITASDFHKVLHGRPTGWKSLIKNKLSPPKEFYAKATEWGKKYEDEAVALFEILENVDTINHGLCFYSKNNDIACSPDFLLADNIAGGGEVKCPSNADNHLQVVVTEKTPRIYLAQVQGSMLVTETEKWWFMSYDPRLEPESRLCRFLVDRDDKYIALLEKKLVIFLQCLKEGRCVDDAFAEMTGSGNSLPKLF